MKTRMSILIASAPDKEKVFAELYYDGEIWAMVSQEEDALLLEIVSNIDGAPSKFALEDVMDVLQKAKKALLGESKG